VNEIVVNKQQLNIIHIIDANSKRKATVESAEFISDIVLS